MSKFNPYRAMLHVHGMAMDSPADVQAMADKYWKDAPGVIKQALKMDGWPPAFIQAVLDRIQTMRS